MSIDIASLGVRVDTTQVASAETNLDKFTASAASAETQTESLSRAASALNASYLAVSSASLRTQRAMAGVASGARLTAHEALNLSRQLADVGVTAAMGMNPLLILVQQGPQIADIMKTSGLGVKGIAVEIGLMIGVLRRTTVATGALAVANAELAAATAAVTAAEQAALVSTNRLGAERAVAAARGAQAAAATRVAAAETSSLALGLTGAGAILTGLAAVAVVATGVLIVGWKSVQKEVGDVTKGMGLSEKQLERIKEKGISTTVTLGDTFKAFFQVTGSRLYDAFETPIEWLKEQFENAWEAITHATYMSFKFTVQGAFGTVAAIKETWKVLPAVMGDLATQAANNFLDAIEWMINKSIDGLNKLIEYANKGAEKVGLSTRLGPVDGVSFDRFENKNEGAAKAGLKSVYKAMKAGEAEGGRAADSFLGDVVGQARKNREDALREGAGDAEKGAKAERDRQLEQAENFLKSLKEETAEIGKNRIEVKMMAAERAAALAPTEKLKSAIRDAAEEWKKATVNQALKELKQDLQDQAKAEEFETSLLKMNAKEREVANAQRAITIRLLALEREGITLTAEQIKAETDAILKNAEARGQKKLDVDNARAYADAMRDLTDVLRESVDGFGELFGTAGAGFENLINVIADYADKRVELETKINDMSDQSAKGDAERARAREQLERATIASYGNMLGAAKTFFKEGSTGYKVLEAAERAYRLYQLVSTMIYIASKAKAVAADTAHTASSVANSGARASADGIAAVAKAIASLPFPLNLIAGAATIAALVAVGVKIAGGGKGASAAATSASSESSSYKEGDSAAMTSPYSTLPGQGGLYNPNNAGIDGTPTPASPNSQAVGSQGSAGFVYAPTINAPNADAGTVERIQDILRTHQGETIQMAREAAASDRAYINSRQRIGGS